MFDFEIDRLINEIIQYKAKRVLLQLPEGVRPYAFEITEAIEAKSGIEVIISGDSCYGACDLSLNQAMDLEADLLIHYGHSRFIKETELPVLYIELQVNIDLEKLFDETFLLLKNWERVGISTTVQHTHQIHKVKEMFDSKGIRSLIGAPTELLPYHGQILGCNYDTARKISDRVEGFLYIGSGKFHPLGLAIVTGRPVIKFNPFVNKAKIVEQRDLMKIAKKRVAAINASKQAETVGIVVSSKIGQRRVSEAKEIRKDFREKGVKSYILYMDEVRGGTLHNFVEADAFIITACPRIALDGLPEIDKPLLTMGEAKVTLGDLAWEELWNGGYFNSDMLGDEYN